MLKNSFKLKILLAGITVIALISIGSVWYFKYQAAPANQPAGENQPISWIFYTTPSDWQDYGNFDFQYPAELALKKYGVETIDGVKRHVVILVEGSQFNSATTTDIIEINAKVGNEACAAYKKCETVGGVVIGTNSDGKTFLGYFDKIVRGFKAGFPPSPAAN